MKIFISWSGELSKQVAIIFREWIPSVIQSIDPYVSSEDIEKGARWSSDISKALEECIFGILCITNDNIEAPWINFEAGALSKSFDDSKIVPFLFDISQTAVKGPLVQFQSTLFEKDDIYRLLTTINKSCSTECIDDGRLKSTFEKWWPDLEEKLNKLKDQKKNIEKKKSPPQDPSSTLEEILLLVRGQQKLLNSPAELLPPGYIRDVFPELEITRNRIHPDALSELDRSFAKLMREVEDFCSSNPDDTEGRDRLLNAIKRIQRPIEHILRRSRVPQASFGLSRKYFNFE